MKAWGKHLVLDCAGCDYNAITNQDTIREFLKELVKRIDMVAHGEPQIEFLLPGTYNEGFSVFQMITTSNITIHFVNMTQEAYFDIFSCKDYDIEIAKQTVRDFFSPVSLKVTVLERQA